MLLSEGARTDISDNDSNTALHYACSSAKPNEKIIYLLLRRGLNVNAPNKNGTSPFHLACKYASFAISEILLGRGANKNDVDRNGNTALHYASSSNYTNTGLINLLLDSGLEVNSVNNYGASPVHLARKSDNIDMLLKAGGQLHSLDNNKNNILHYVSQRANENVKLLNHLLSVADFNLNARNNCGTTPLQLACRSGNFLIVEKLHETGAELNILDNDNKNALHYALQSPKENTCLVNYLIHNGIIDVNAQDVQGKTPLELGADAKTC
ncbi:hypothetical protein Zmor_018690 [Zophobas morio]|uniref:Ankyrin repeat protein n=1 Tax=Zophobas morio TaxID=2755281 RepID=A0AA38I7W7_9CUCU|nr:hypothetical protein Zmor_018690 [Zophobas morio]